MSGHDQHLEVFNPQDHDIHIPSDSAYVQQRGKPRTYSCDHPGCDKKYTANWMLTRHQVRHTNQKNFVCDHKEHGVVCGKRFFEKHELKRHISSHSERRPWICENPRCKLGFKSKAELKSHQAKVHTVEAAEGRELKLQHKVDNLKQVADLLVEENNELRNLLIKNNINPPKSRFRKNTYRLRGVRGNRQSKRDMGYQSLQPMPVMMNSQSAFTPTTAVSYQQPKVTPVLEDLSKKRKYVESEQAALLRTARLTQRRRSLKKKDDTNEPKPHHGQNPMIQSLSGQMAHVPGHIQIVTQPMTNQQVASLQAAVAQAQAKLHN